MNTPGLRFQTTPADQAVVLQVTGDVDFSNSPELRQALLSVLQPGPARLIVDLAGVSYMDSSGVATLVEALQVQRRHGRQVVLCGLQPKVKGIFEIARLNMVFTIAGDRRQALAPDA